MSVDISQKRKRGVRQRERGTEWNEIDARFVHVLDIIVLVAIHEMEVRVCNQCNLYHNYCAQHFLF